MILKKSQVLEFVKVKRSYCTLLCIFSPNLLATSTNGEIKSPLLQEMFGQLPNRQDEHPTVLSYHRWLVYLQNDIRRVGKNESLLTLIPDPVAQGKNLEPVMRALRGLTDVGITIQSQLAEANPSNIQVGPGFQGKKLCKLL